MSAKLEKIIISINEKQIELDIIEAKSLKQALNEILPDPVLKHDHYWPWWVDWPYRKFTVTSSDNISHIHIYDSMASNTLPKENK